MRWHDAIARRYVERFRGRVVSSTGDGICATFDGPARGIRCAGSMHDEFRNLGLRIRAGLHTGEVEMRGDEWPESPSTLVHESPVKQQPVKFWYQEP
jgi:class 3 adenylate cyclase